MQSKLLCLVLVVLRSISVKRALNFITVSFFFFCSKAFSQLIFSALKLLTNFWTERRKINSLFTLKCISGFKFGITLGKPSFEQPGPEYTSQSDISQGSAALPSCNRVRRKKLKVPILWKPWELSVIEWRTSVPVRFRVGLRS